MRCLQWVILCLAATVAVAQTPSVKKHAPKQTVPESAYRDWVQYDVAYIITDAEKQAFNRLSNDDERDQFIEQFWLRRDPTPDTAENEFKEEHYRRIAYVNEHFASGVPGSRTDRGMIYIKYGAPDEIEAHPSGGTYQRPIEQGVAQTMTYPFEIWRYRYLEGIGTNVLLEFVDQSQSGEYRLTIDPQEKDALQHVPGYQAPVLSPGQNEFDRLKLRADVQKPPALRFHDLEAVVNSNIRYNTLPIRVRTDYFPVTPSSILSNVTVQFNRGDLQVRESDGVTPRAIVNLFARITTLARRNVSTFEDVLVVDGISAAAIYQKSVPLAPGKYRLSIVARDVVGGTTATYESAIEVPAFPEDQLAASSVILADVMERVPTRSIGPGQFVIGDTKVRPRVDETFSNTEKLGIYVQLYHLTNVTIEYEIDAAGSSDPVMRYAEDVVKPAEQFTVKKWLPLANVAPGEYTLRLSVTDKATNQTIMPSATFTVVAQTALR